MAKVYSERFVSASFATGWFGYTVPQGKRAVVKSFAATDVSLVTGHTELQVDGIIAALIIYPAAARQTILELRAVAYAGETINVFVGVVGISVMCSGYLFDDPDNASGPPASVSLQPKPGPPPTVLPGA